MKTFIMLRIRVVRINIASIFILLFLACSITTSAQYQSRPFEHLTQEDGLSSNSVYNMFQDKEGYIWFGTMGGLNRYDGYSFVTYKREAYNPNSLPDNWITQMEEDSQGYLWVGTHNGGLSRFDRKTGSFYNFMMHDSVPVSLRSHIIWGLMEDSQGKLWVGHGMGYERIDPQTLKIDRVEGDSSLRALVRKRSVNVFCETEKYMLIGTWGNGLIVYNKNSHDSFRLKRDGSPNSISGNKVKQVVAYNDSIVFVGTQRGGLNRLNINTWKFTRPKNEGLRKTFVNSIKIDAQQHVWIGSQRDGLFFYDPQTEEAINYRYQPDVYFGLNSNWVPNILIDTSGLLWVATDFGASKTQAEGSGFHNYPLELLHPEQRTYNVSSLLSVEGNYWVGTLGGGLYEFDPGKGEFVNNHSSFINATIPSPRVWAMTKDADNTIWLGTGQGLIKYNTESRKLTEYHSSKKSPHTLPHDNISALHLNEDELWVGTYSGGLGILDLRTDTFENFAATNTEDGLPSNFVICIFQDSKGRYWIGTESGGLSLFDRKTKSFKTYRYQEDNPQSISSNNVSGIVEMEDGTFYIATEGGGFCHFDPESEVFTNYNEKNGLSDNKVSFLIKGQNNTLWLATAQGLNRFDVKNKSFEILTRQNGLLENHFNRGGLLLPDGNFCLSTKTGFVHVTPDKVNTTPFDPPIVITKFKRFNSEENINNLLGQENTLRLSYDDYVIAFDFAALDFRAPSRNRYSYILEGFDHDWVQLEHQHSITFPALPDGRYTLRVRGTNSEGKLSSNELAINIVVDPPFYKKIWFYFTVLLVGLLSVYGFIAWRTQRLRNMRKELQKQVKQRTSELEVEKRKVEDYSHEVEKQRDFVTQQRDLIVNQNKELTDSIVYAKRIQNGLLPDANFLESFFPASFVLFKPRDIVSGDFYWHAKQGDYLYLTVADCTGHGVPGAFMSLLGISHLTEILKAFKQPTTGEVLNQLRYEITHTLAKGSNERKIREGIDMALVKIDIKQQKMEFSGAYNGVYIVRAGNSEISGCDRFMKHADGNFTLSEYKGQRTPIAQHEKLTGDFATRTIQLMPGDRVYMLTDGYVDQMDERMKRKYYAKVLKEKLLKIQDKALAEQLLFLELEHQNWKGEARQVDDILMVGFEV